MRALILALVATAAFATAAHAAGCSGNGSQTVLTILDWSVQKKDGLVLLYRLDEPQSVNLLQGHVYFAAPTDEILADGPLELKRTSGMGPTGATGLVLSKPMIRHLAAADAGTVTAFACTNYMEYADGSAIIID